MRHENSDRRDLAAPDCDGSDHFRTASDQFDARPRSRLVALLSGALAEAAGAGDLKAVRIVGEAIGRLLDDAASER